MGIRLERYLRMSHLPHMWCPGCGIGIVVKAMLTAVDELGWEPEETAVVSGIGCTSRTPGYVDMNTLHPTHGRALSFATGIKMVQPAKHVIVIAGDGDSTAIGGNHFIHACRRNIDITMVIVNNNIYGMTGGQFSPTTPLGARAATTPWGNIDPSFDIVNIAKGAGASYVARGHVGSALQLRKMIKDGLNHHGFSVIEAMSNCHTQFGRRNRLADPIELINHIAKQTINVRQAAKKSPEELKGKILIGVMHKDDEKDEYCDAYQKVIDRAQAMVKQ
jgi:2-oxoglutarate ferredoxin oxidoreductase subunit beta